MNGKMAKFVIGAGILLFPFLISLPLRAQVAGTVLSGTVTDLSGKACSQRQNLHQERRHGSIDGHSDQFGRHVQRNKPRVGELRGFRLGGWVRHQRG